MKIHEHASTVLYILHCNEDIFFLRYNSTRQIDGNIAMRVTECCHLSRPIVVNHN